MVDIDFIIRLMGNLQKDGPGNTQDEVYLSDLRGWSEDQLMFQSKLSQANIQTRLQRRVYAFSSSSDNITSFIQKLQFYGQNIDCDNLMLPVYCYIRQMQNFCSDQKELEVYHQLYPINLKEEITARKRCHQKFTQTQIWYLFYSMVNACRKFEPYKLKSGHLKTRNIVLNQRGHVKVRNQLTQPQIEVSVLPNFFSPEELKNMRQGREGRQSKVHPNICQTFSIAIVLLEVCTFLEGDSFYDMYRMRFNEVVLSRALQMLQKLRYSKLLTKLLAVMVSGPNDRPLPSQLHQIFRPYQKQIVSLSEFKFDPQKIADNLQNSNVSLASLY